MFLPVRRSGTELAAAAAAFVLAAFVLAALGASAAPAGPLGSGVRGIVLIGPTCPVERADQPCPDLPFELRIRVLRAHLLVARTRSGPDGHFRVALPPGLYVLAPVLGPGPPSAPPVAVRVRPHRFAFVTIRVDSGIR